MVLRSTPTAILLFSLARWLIGSHLIYEVTLSPHLHYRTRPLTGRQYKRTRCHNYAVLKCAVASPVTTSDYTPEPLYVVCLRSLCANHHCNNQAQWDVKQVIVGYLHEARVITCRSGACSSIHALNAGGPCEETHERRGSWAADNVHQKASFAPLEKYVTL